MKILRCDTGNDGDFKGMILIVSVPPPTTYSSPSCCFLLLFLLWAIAVSDFVVTYELSLRSVYSLYTWNSADFYCWLAGGLWLTVVLACP